MKFLLPRDWWIMWQRHFRLKACQCLTLTHDVLTINHFYFFKLLSVSVLVFPKDKWINFTCKLLYHILQRNANSFLSYYFSSSIGVRQITLVDARNVQSKWRMWLCKKAWNSNAETSMWQWVWSYKDYASEKDIKGKHTIIVHYSILKGKFFCLVTS